MHLLQIFTNHDDTTARQQSLEEKRKTKLDKLVIMHNLKAISQCGAKWGFSGPLFEGCKFCNKATIKFVNTCPIDSTLTSLLLLRSHLPGLARIINSKDVELNQVLNMMLDGKHDEARQDWIEVLSKKKPFGKKSDKSNMHRTWNCESTLSCATEAVQSFYFFQTTERTKCSNPNCLFPDGTERKDNGYRHVVILNENGFLDNIQGFFDEMYHLRQAKIKCNCRPHRPAYIQCPKNGDGSFNLISPNENKSNCCYGERKFREIIVKHPTMLVLSLNDCTTKQYPCVSEIPSTLIVQRQRYVLSAVMLHNGGHFRSVTLIPGHILLYDGLFDDERILPISLTTRFADGQGFAVRQIWYTQQQIYYEQIGIQF